MISFQVLKEAKAFLCWEVCKDLGVQLVPMRPAVAYYYPPRNPRHAIVVFYNPGSRDLSEALFLLFHEAGHAMQWMRLSVEDKADYFHAMIDADKGVEKTAFEQEAWDRGREFLEKFVSAKCLDPELVALYDLYGRACLLSYRNPSSGESS